MHAGPWRPWVRPWETPLHREGLHRSSSRQKCSRHRRGRGGGRGGSPPPAQSLLEFSLCTARGPGGALGELRRNVSQLLFLSRRGCWKEWVGWLVWADRCSGVLTNSCFSSQRGFQAPGSQCHVSRMIRAHGRLFPTLQAASQRNTRGAGQASAGSRAARGRAPGPSLGHVIQ